jgi:TetR/AcrR family transcriptional regulator, repressor of fatR-cypB operon
MARTPANVQPGQIRERIIAAALQLFTQRGYFSTSVPDMARTAQVSVGSIYHHFKDKEDVARALFVGLMEGLQEALAKIAHDNATAHDRCRAVMAMLFELTESNRDAMDFMLYAKHRDFLPSERPVCSSKPFETMRAFVQDGMENGEIRNMDVMVATSCLFGGAIRLITARLDGVLAEPLPDRLDAVWDCAWRGVAA